MYCVLLIFSLTFSNRVNWESLSNKVNDAAINSNLFDVLTEPSQSGSIFEMNSNPFCLTLYDVFIF